jgi:hypothetical protein
MAVRLYAGGLARFFLGEWRRGLSDEGDAEAASAEGDGDDDASGDDAGEEATPAEVQAYFEAFRGALAAELAEALEEPLAWSEALSGPEIAVSVAGADFGALMVIAARAAVADKRMSPVSAKREWFEDPAVEKLQTEEEEFTPAHHLVQADTWLPADFDVVLASEVPERDLIIGSLARLREALADSAGILAGPCEVTRKLQPALVEGARRAQAALETAAAFAAEHGLPLLIDPT